MPLEADEGKRMDGVQVWAWRETYCESGGALNWEGVSNVTAIPISRACFRGRQYNLEQARPFEP